VVNIGIGLASFVFLGREPALWKFGALSATGIAAGLVSISLMRRIPGGGPGAARSRRRGAWVDLRLVLRDGSFLSYAAWTSLGLFVTVGQNTLIVLSLRDYLRITPGTIMFATAVGSAAAMVVGPWWGRLADRHGSGPVQVLAGATMAAALMCFALLRPQTPLVLVIAVSAACAVSYSGFFVAANRGMLQRMRPSLRAGYSAVWLSITSVAMGSSSVLIGLVVQHAGQHAYAGLCLAYGLLMAAAALRYTRLRDEGTELATELRSQFDAERPVVSMVRLCRYVLDPPDTE
jgi:predicted MFS family arabinose efflux permease